uniref:SAM domain-containing protein n=1 Tax=Romanomermis culicivorax TaxID=13658 RepID=A0A915JVQ1_ROMCU
MTISKMTPEDLTAVGVTKPSHRKRLTAEIKRLGLVDNWPVQSPLTLKSWLIDLGLQQYVPWFAAQGYVSVEQILNLAWEDFEDVGVKKLGHLKKLVCAVKKLKDHRRRRNSGRAGNHRSSVCSVDETSSSVSSTSPTFQNGRNDTGGNVDYSGRIGEVLRINVPSGQNSARSTTSGQYSMNSNCDTVSLRSMSSSRSTLLTFNCHPLTDSQDNVRETDILCADYEDRHDQVTPHRNGDFGSQFQKSQNSPSQVEPYSIGSSFCKRSPAKNNFCESLSVLTGRCPDFGD